MVQENFTVPYLRNKIYSKVEKMHVLLLQIRKMALDLLNYDL